MELWNAVKENLNNKEIVGEDGRKYRIEVSDGSIFSIFVKDIEDGFSYGTFPQIRDLGKKLLEAEVVEFTNINGNGLYKKTLNMISEAVPSGTIYKSGMANSQDRDNLYEYVENNKESLNVKNALEKTCLGHVMLSSKFNNIKLFYKGKPYYKGRNKIRDEFEDVEALLQFRDDRKKGIYANHGTEICLVGTKN